MTVFFRLIVYFASYTKKSIIDEFAQMNITESVIGTIKFVTFAILSVHRLTHQQFLNKMKTIDLNDYVKSGAGANGDSYFNLRDENEMVKLYNPDYPTGSIYDELEVAQKVYREGIPSPEPGVLVTDGERIGIQFRRIVGKRSFSRMLADEPERVAEFAGEFARCCKELHSHECAEGAFPDAKQQFLSLLEAVEQPASIKGRMEDFIRCVPDCNTALHGDMHIGNLISTLPAGAPLSSPHKVMFIDLGYFSHGFPLFDFGMFRAICLSSDEEFRQHDFHVNGKMTAEFWNHMVREYFFSSDRLAEKYFGPGQTVESVTGALVPYECCKYLLVQYNLGFLPENYQKVLNATFG